MLRVPVKTSIIAVLVSLFGTTQVLADIIPIDPRATYLLTNMDPHALNAPAIDLATLGLGAGDQVALQTLGDYCFSGGLSIPVACPAGEVATPMIGVFSATNTLLDSSILNRVPGAITTGVLPVVTPPTLMGGLATDIPQDFRIRLDPFSTILTIPDGAEFLFVGVADTFYGDNHDPDNDLALSIAEISEPPSLALLLASIGSLWCIRRRSQKRRCQCVTQ